LSNATSDGSFVVDPVSGEIRTSAAIDRENRTSHRLTVLAHNVGHLPSSSADVIIRVIDVNDNSPTLRRAETICVGRSTSRGRTVGRLRATDADEGPNAMLKFRWISVDDDVGTELFRLSLDDGRVIAKTDMSMRAAIGQHFRFRVTVEDVGMPARSAVGTVSIVFNDTCAVADRRRSPALPGAAAREPEWHGAVTVLVVSALFGTTLGVGIVALYMCRKHWWRVVSQHRRRSHRDSTQLESIRCFNALPDDPVTISIHDKLQFALSDPTTNVAMVNCLILFLLLLAVVKL